MTKKALIFHRNPGCSVYQHVTDERDRAVMYLYCLCYSHDTCFRMSSSLEPNTLSTVKVETLAVETVTFSQNEPIARTMLAFADRVHLKNGVDVSSH